MCWLLCLVSYNPVGADPKPHLKKKSNYFIPWVLSANKIDKQKLPVDLWRFRTKTRKATSSASDNGYDSWLIFLRECFSLERPPNDSSHNYILYNTFFFITTDDNCVGQFFFFFFTPSCNWSSAARSVTFLCILITQLLIRSYTWPWQLAHSCGTSALFLPTPSSLARLKTFVPASSSFSLSLHLLRPVTVLASEGHR